MKLLKLTLAAALLTSTLAVATANSAGAYPIVLRTTQGNAVILRDHDRGFHRRYFMHRVYGPDYWRFHHRHDFGRVRIY